MFFAGEPGAEPTESVGPARVMNFGTCWLVEYLLHDQRLPSLLRRLPDSEATALS